MQNDSSNFDNLSYPTIPIGHSVRRYRRGLLYFYSFSLKIFVQPSSLSFRRLLLYCYNNKLIYFFLFTGQNSLLLYLRKASNLQCRCIWHRLKQLACIFCDKVFWLMCDLRDHLVTHQRPKVCCVCGSSFKHRQSLNRHSLEHTDGFPVTCDVCGKQFLTKGKLSSHSLTHGPKEKCASCSNDEINLEKH